MLRTSLTAASPIGAAIARMLLQKEAPSGTRINVVFLLSEQRAQIPQPLIPLGLES